MVLRGGEVRLTHVSYPDFGLDEMRRVVALRNE
jgi:hypothetical protein